MLSHSIRNLKALHYSTGKSGVDQIPPEVLLEWGQVFSYGEKKYERNNWRRGTDWHEFMGSALRHLLAFWAGEDDDPESTLPHLSHVLWNVGALRYYQIKHLGYDDRPGGGTMICFDCQEDKKTTTCEDCGAEICYDCMGWDHQCRPEWEDDEEEEGE